MENEEAYAVIKDSLDRACLYLCSPEWDNCRHKEAQAWLELLLAQIDGMNANL